MGWTFLPIAILPKPDDLVWCKFPHSNDRGKPGPCVRPTLVRAAYIREHPDTGEEFGSLEVSYGTGEYDESHLETDLVVKDSRRVRALGLHKSTRFSLAPKDKVHLIWCEEYFEPQRYVVGRGIHIGRLGAPEVSRMKDALIKRGLLPAP